MKKYILLLSSIALFSCNSGTPGKYNTSDYGTFPLEVPEQNSLMYRWESKPVIKAQLIDDMETGAGWTVSGIGESSYTNDRSKDGKQSLRFRTSLRDEEHYRENRTEWGSFGGTQGGNSAVEKHFDVPQDWSAFNRIAFWVYPHQTSNPRYCLFLVIENKGTVYNATTPRDDDFIQDLKPGKWNHVLFEIPHIQRDSITGFMINQMLIGTNPGEDSIMTYDIDNLELQVVDADQYEGWNVAPGRFSFSHAGYRPGDIKTALAGEGAGDDFQIIDREGNVAFSGKTEEISTVNGSFHLVDFSDLRKKGNYTISSGSVRSDPFPVNENIWIQPVCSAMNFFFCERCGYDVPGIHKECHTDWQGFHGDIKKVINGGWHDAGDLSQGAWRTSMAAFAMMANIESLQKQNVDSELVQKLKSELTWGLEWLLKTRFGDGFHMSFSVMRIYTDGKTGTLDDVISPARNVPWENFLTSAVFSKAAEMLEVSNPGLAGKARTAAAEDWQAAFSSKDRWDEADYREASWGVTSSLLLAKSTGDKKYGELAVNFGNLLVKCQEQRFAEGIPITGYFYQNTSRDKIIHNLHASFEEAPLIALSMLCNELPDNEKWIDWYSASVLHSEFFMKRGSGIAAPYYHLPNSVWKVSEIMEEETATIREDMLRQFNDGTHLNKNYVLRTFPIYRDGLFHGNTNIQMSDAWALAEASRLRHDEAGMELVGRQLRWVLGNNPFGTSLMYGVGYNFAPHFSYCLKDVVGSLPVGMDCMSGDMPHWCSTNTATSKEIWVEPVSRFLGTVAIYAAHDTIQTNQDVTINTKATQSEKGLITVTVTLTGAGKHQIGMRAFNAKGDLKPVEIELSENKPATISFSINIIDRQMPYVAVIDIDGDPLLRKEVTGSFVKSSL